jgi:alpha-tubulin suppressor-like RCC1 family protein
MRSPRTLRALPLAFSGTLAATVSMVGCSVDTDKLKFVPDELLHAGPGGSGGSGDGLGGDSGRAGSTNAGAGGESGGPGGGGKGGVAGGAGGGSSGASGATAGAAGAQAGTSGGGQAGSTAGSAGTNTAGSAGTNTAGSSGATGGTNAGGTNAGGTNAGGTNAGGTNAGGTNAGGAGVGGTTAAGGGGQSGGGQAGSSTQGGAAGSAGSPTFGDACGNGTITCQSCLKSACVGECNTCSALLGCPEAAACASTCADDACVAACLTGVSIEISDAIGSLSLCYQGSCATDCGQGSGGGGSGGAGGAATCTQGTFSCTASGDLQACETPPTLTTVESCGSATQCDANRGKCLTCTPGTFSCNDRVLEECNQDGSSYEAVETCASATDCVASGMTGGCVACGALTYSCNPTVVISFGGAGKDGSSFLPRDEVRRCSGDGFTTTSIAHCNADNPVCDPGQGKCLRCVPSQYSCEGTALRHCNSAGTDFDTYSQCDSPALCDSAAGKCQPRTCQPSTFLCNGTTLQQCNSDGTAAYDWQICGPNGYCDANNARCLDCDPTKYYNCDTSDPNNPVWYSCDNGRKHVVMHCSTGACDPNNGCAAGCQQGSAVCYPGSSGVETCGVTYTDCTQMGAKPDQTCQEGGGCHVCYPGEGRCFYDAAAQAQIAQRCEYDATIGDYTWTKGTNCNNVPGSYCDGYLGSCRVCTPNTYGCVSDATGKQMYTYCQGDATWSPGGQDCSPGYCQPWGCYLPATGGSCVQGQHRCQGAKLQTCTAQNYFQDDKTCASASLCNDISGCMAPTKISAGLYHTCAIVESTELPDRGIVLCWGLNASGQLGAADSLILESYEPRTVVVNINAQTGLVHGVYNAFTDVCGGEAFSCASVKDPSQGNSFAICWGSNEQGQLGILSDAPGPYFAPEQPVRNTDTAVNNDVWKEVQSVTCGGQFACALDNTGVAFCWGNNEYGQLGAGIPDVKSNYARAIPNHLFIGVGAGSRHACGVKDDGSVWCWGDNSRGQLGIGVIGGTYSEPQQVMAATSNKQIPGTAGSNFAVIIPEAGSLLSWGVNDYGQLGTGTRVSNASPASVSGLDAASITSLFSGSTASHVCSRGTTDLSCWGANVFGQLGIGSTADSLVPTVVLDSSSAAKKLANGVKVVGVGGEHTCAITQAGLRCWGSNAHGQLGTNLASTVQKTPIAVKFN